MALTTEALAAELLPGRTLTAAETARLDRLRQLAGATVDATAPDAPEAAQDEAVVRVVGYLWSRPGSRMQDRSFTVGPDIRLGRIINVDAMRASGAASVLRPWRKVAVGREVEP